MSGRARAPAFIGRHREIAAMQADLGRVLGGEGRVVHLVGESGCGKTRLAGEFAEQARARGLRVLRGTWYESAEKPPYIGFLAALSELGSVGAFQSSVILDPYVQEACRLCPDLLALTCEPALARRIPGSAGRSRLWEGIARTLATCAAIEPLILWLEDVHWIDEASASLLAYLGHRCRSSRLMLLCAYRDEEVDETHPLRATESALTHTGSLSRISLSGLSREEVGALAVDFAQTALAAEFVDTLFSITQGNPLFACELMRDFAERGLLETSPAKSRPILEADFSLPDGVEDAMRRRFAGLSGKCQELLAEASVVGRDFDARWLARVTGRHPAALLELLDEAISANALRQVSPRTYEFSHPLMRAAVYRRLPPSRRLTAHLNVAQALMRAEESSPQVREPEIARHLIAAGPLCEPVELITHCLRGGQQANEVFAYGEACYLLNQGLAASDRLGPEERDEDSLCRLLLALGPACSRVGDVDAARRTHLRAAEIARRLGQPEFLGRAAVGLGEFYDAGVVDWVLVRTIEEALDRMDQADSALRARLLGRLAVALYYTDVAGRREALSAEAVRMARRLDDPQALADALGSRHGALWGPENVDERLRLADEMVHSAQLADDKEREFEGRSWRISDALELGDLASVDRDLDACDRLTKELHQPVYDWERPLRRAMRALLVGDFPEGERLSNQAFAVGNELDSRAAQPAYAVQLFLRYRDVGRLHELEPVIKSFVGEHAAVPAWRAGLAFLYADTGRIDEARADFEELTGAGFDAIPRDAQWLVAVTLLAETSAALGDAACARALYLVLLPYAGRFVVIGPGIACLGAASHYLGVLAAAAGDEDAAARHFKTALQQNHCIGARPWLARTQLEYARLLLRSHGAAERRLALTLLEEAERTFKELGMSRESQRAGEAHRLLGRGRRPSVARPHGLTERELAVLRLLVGGRSNAEIAERLSLSRKTVERHLANIYTKVDVSSRTAAMAFAIREQLI